MALTKTIDGCGCCGDCKTNCDTCSLRHVRLTFPPPYDVNNIDGEPDQFIPCYWTAESHPDGQFAIGAGMGIVCINGCWVIVVSGYLSDGAGGMFQSAGSSDPFGCGQACPPLGSYAIHQIPGNPQLEPVTVTLS
jgi:hypothetical protein